MRIAAIDMCQQVRGRAGTLLDGRDWELVDAQNLVLLVMNDTWNSLVVTSQVRRANMLTLRSDGLEKQVCWWINRVSLSGLLIYIFKQSDFWSQTPSLRMFEELSDGEVQALERVGSHDEEDVEVVVAESLTDSAQRLVIQRRTAENEVSCCGKPMITVLLQKESACVASAEENIQSFEEEVSRQNAGQSHDSRRTLEAESIHSPSNDMLYIVLDGKSFAWNVRRLASSSLAFVYKQID